MCEVTVKAIPITVYSDDKKEEEEGGRRHRPSSSSLRSVCSAATAGKKRKGEGIVSREGGRGEVHCLPCIAAWLVHQIVRGRNVQTSVFAKNQCQN